VDYVDEREIRAADGADCPRGIIMKQLLGIFVVAFTAIVGFGASTATAGGPGGTALIVYYFGNDAGAEAAANAAVPQVFQGGSDVTGTFCPAATVGQGPGGWQTSLSCPLPNGDYAVGIDAG
jgi:hypothetical protein